MSISVNPYEKQLTRVPFMDPEEREQIMTAPKVYIYSVYPKEFIDYRGTLGRRVIPACGEGQEVSEPLVIDGWLPETVVDAVDGLDIQMKWVKTSGRKVAMDILAQKDMNQRTLVDYGVFVAHGPIPTQAEVTAARERLFAIYASRVKEADRKYQVNGGMEAGDDGKFRSAITEDDVDAGKAMGLKRDWMAPDPKSAKVLCPECDEPIKATASMCSHCEAVFDEARARKTFPHKFAEEKRGPGRPKAEA